MDSKFLCTCVPSYVCTYASTCIRYMYCTSVYCVGCSVHIEWVVLMYVWTRSVQFFQYDYHSLCLLFDGDNVQDLLLARHSLTHRTVWVLCVVL